MKGGAVAKVIFDLGSLLLSCSESCSPFSCWASVYRLEIQHR